VRERDRWEEIEGERDIKRKNRERVRNIKGNDRERG
jgi:hypothetical protein